MYVIELLVTSILFLSPRGIEKEKKRRREEKGGIRKIKENSFKLCTCSCLMYSACVLPQ
jgi:hypothetical protein